MGLLALFLMAMTELAAPAEKSAPNQPSLTPQLTTPSVDKKLRQAVEQGNLPLLNAAIAEGANVNCRGTNGLPPLLELLRPAGARLDRARRECVACLLLEGSGIHSPANL